MPTLARLARRRPRRESLEHWRLLRPQAAHDGQARCARPGRISTDVSRCPSRRRGCCSDRGRCAGVDRRRPRAPHAGRLDFDVWDGVACRSPPDLHDRRLEASWRCAGGRCAAILGGAALTAYQYPAWVRRIHPRQRPRMSQANRAALVAPWWGLFQGGGAGKDPKTLTFRRMDSVIAAYGTTDTADHDREGRRTRCKTQEPHRLLRTGWLQACPGVAGPVIVAGSGVHFWVIYSRRAGARIRPYAE